MKLINVYGRATDLEVQAPTLQAFDLNFNYGTGELTWSRGNGQKILILLKEAGEVKPPFDNLTYFVGNRYRGSLVIYKGEGSSVSLVHLPAGTYELQAFEFNGQASVEKYLRTETTGNPVTIVIEDGQFGIGAMIIESTFIVG